MDSNSTKKPLINQRDVEIVEMLAGLTESATRTISIPLENVVELINDTENDTSELLDNQIVLLDRIGSAYTRIASALGNIASANYALHKRNDAEGTPAQLDVAVPTVLQPAANLTSEDTILPSDLTQQPQEPKSDEKLTPLELDIPKSLPDGFELLETEADVIKFFMNNGAIRIESLRKQVPSIAKLSNEEYADFKKNFSSLRSRIIDYFDRRNIKAVWLEDGQARGKNYTLSIDRFSIDRTTEEVPTSQTDSEQNKKIETPLVREAIARVFKNSETYIDEANALVEELERLGLGRHKRRDVMASFKRAKQRSTDAAYEQAFNTVRKLLVEAGIIELQTPRTLSLNLDYFKYLVAEFKDESTKTGLEVTPPSDDKARQDKVGGLIIREVVINPLRGNGSVDKTRKIDPKSAEVFANVLSSWVKGLLSEMEPPVIKRGTARNLLMEAFKDASGTHIITKQEADDALQNIIDNEMLFDGPRIKGQATISTAPDVFLKKNNGDNGRELSNENIQWTRDLTEKVISIMDFVYGERHLELGKTIEEIIDNGIRKFEDDVDVERVTKFICRRLNDYGFLTQKLNARVSAKKRGYRSNSNVKTTRYLAIDGPTKKKWLQQRTTMIEEIVATMSE